MPRYATLDERPAFQRAVLFRFAQCVGLRRAGVGLRERKTRRRARGRANDRLSLFIERKEKPATRIAGFSIFGAAPRREGVGLRERRTRRRARGRANDRLSLFIEGKEKPATRIAGFSIIGARSWTRTNDPLINSQVL